MSTASRFSYDGARTPPVRGDSLVSVAYAHIRQRILSGQLAPGERVTVRPLSDDLDLSPTPIRTALSALERQGLLESQDHRGFFVPELNASDFEEIYELREVLEGVASRHAAQSVSRADLVVELRRLLAEQRSAVDEHSMGQYGDLDVEFHREIWRESGRHRLASVADNLFGQMRVGNSISAQVPGRPEASLREHAEIIDAIDTGDAARAERAVRSHIRSAGKALLKSVRAEDSPD